MTEKPARCRICSHEARVAIDEGLLRGQSLRSLAKLHGLKMQTIWDHRKKGHIAKALALAVDAQEVANAGSLLARLSELTGETLEILREARHGRTKDPHVALKAIGRIEAQVELTARLVGELRDSALPPKQRVTLVFNTMGARTLFLPADEAAPTDTPYRSVPPEAAAGAGSEDFAEHSAPPAAVEPEAAPSQEAPSLALPEEAAVPEVAAAAEDRVLAFPVTPEAHVRNLMIFRTPVPWQRLAPETLANVERLLRARLQSSNEADRMFAGAELDRIRAERGF